MLTVSQQVSGSGVGVLADSRILQLIVYVHDLTESKKFYEGLLGLRVVEEDEDSVKLDAGQAILCLYRARDHDITLSEQRDDSSDTVFLVDDLDGMVAAMESRGLTFARRRTYEVGAIVDFYDPNGHRLMLYQPSERAMMTSSSDRMQAVWRASGRGGSAVIGPPAEQVEATARDLASWGLKGKPLIYFFVFIKDMEQSTEFYERRLGLRAIERTHCCNHVCPGEEKGIVKYDGTGLILSSHHMHGHYAVFDDNGNPYGAKDFEPEFAKGVAPVFHVADIERAVRELSRRGVEFRHPLTRTRAGRTIRLDAPSGHLYHLYEPSAEALTGPLGSKIKQLLSEV